jgi:multidrug efflux pump
VVEATVEACALRFRPIPMTGVAFVCDVLPMVIAHGASQQALGTGVMGGMIAVVILALLMVPVFFVSVQRVLARDRDAAEAPVPEVRLAAPAIRSSCAQRGASSIPRCPSYT